MNISKVLEKMQNDITDLSQRINHHEHNLGSEIHPVAYGGNSGFIDYTTYERAFQEFNIRKVIEKEVDIFNLEPGSYVLNTFNGVKNLPNETNIGLVSVEGLILVDVRDYGSGRKLIKCIPAWQANIYVCTLHTNGATSGWKKIRGMQQIFRGNVTSSSSEIVNFSLTVPTTTINYITVTGASPAGNEFSFTCPFNYKQRTISSVNGWEDGKIVGINADEITIVWTETGFSLKDKLRINSDSNGNVRKVDSGDWVVNSIFVE